MIDCSDRIVELGAIAGITVLGSVALVVDGSIGESIAVAAAAVFGAMARHYWPLSGVESNGSKEENQSKV